MDSPKAFGPYFFETEHPSPNGPGAHCWSHRKEYQFQTNYLFRWGPAGGSPPVVELRDGHFLLDRVHAWGERDVVRFVELHGHAW